MDDRQVKSLLLAELRKLKAAEGSAHHGVCGQLAEAIPELEPCVYAAKLFRRMSKLWPDYSGDEEFPVPALDPRMSPITAYAITSAPDRWSRAHPYGAARWALVEFVIEELEKELNNAG